MRSDLYVTVGSEQFHSSGSRNFIGYQNANVDGLLEKARLATDPQQKKALFRDVHARIAKDHPMVFLWTLDSYAALSTRVKNVSMVHPVLWTAQEGIWNHWDAHGGIVNRSFKLRHERSLSGALHEGMLWIKPLRVLGAGLFAMKNWHVADYNLFWENIRMNLIRQVELVRFADRRSRELP